MSSARATSLLGAATVASTLLFGLGCDALQNPANPETPLWRHRPGSAFTVLLRRSVTAEARKVDLAYERGRPAIDSAHRRVFVGSSDHGLYALRAEDLTTIWRYETLGAVQSEPMYDGATDSLYFGSNDGALYKVRAKDGQLLWRFASNAEVARPPVLRDGVVYFTNANDTLVALNEETGELLWHQHRTPAFGIEVAGHAGAALGRDLVYTAFSDGVVMAYSTKDGSEQWPIVDLAAEGEEQEGDIPQYLDSDPTPIVDTIESGDVVYVGSYAAGVFALDARSGGQAWSNPAVRGVTELVLWSQPAHAPRHGEGPDIPAKKVLLASSGPTGLWGLDPEDGRTLWRRDLPEGGITAPVPWAGAVLVGTTRYGLFLFSPLDGALIDGINTGGDIAMTPAAYGHRAYVMTNAGNLLGLHIAAPPGAG